MKRLHLPYPTDGVNLGQGFSIEDLSPKANTALSFRTQTTPSPDWQYSLTSIKSEEHFQAAISAAMTESTDFLLASESVKADWSATVSLDSQYRYILVTVRGIIAVESTVPTDGETYQLHTSITDDFYELYGDAFVSSIRKGVLFLALLRSNQKHTKVDTSANVDTSGKALNTEAWASLKTHLDVSSDSDSLEINLRHVGGTVASSTPTTLGQLMAAIEEFPKGIDGHLAKLSINVLKYEDVLGHIAAPSKHQQALELIDQRCRYLEPLVTVLAKESELNLERIAFCETNDKGRGYPFVKPFDLAQAIRRRIDELAGQREEIAASGPDAKSLIEKVLRDPAEETKEFEFRIKMPLPKQHVLLTAPSRSDYDSGNGLRPNVLLDKICEYWIEKALLARAENGNSRQDSIDSADLNSLKQSLRFGWCLSPINPGSFNETSYGQLGPVRNQDGLYVPAKYFACSWDGDKVRGVWMQLGDGDGVASGNIGPCGPCRHELEKWCMSFERGECLESGELWWTTYGNYSLRGVLLETRLPGRSETRKRTIGAPIVGDGGVVPLKQEITAGYKIVGMEAWINPDQFVNVFRFYLALASECAE